jgi:hypothetical protein
MFRATVLPSGQKVTTKQSNYQNCCFLCLYPSRPVTIWKIKNALRVLNCPQKQLITNCGNFGRDNNQDVGNLIQGLRS